MVRSPCYSHQKLVWINTSIIKWENQGSYVCIWCLHISVRIFCILYFHVLVFRGTYCGWGAKAKVTPHWFPFTHPPFQWRTHSCAIKSPVNFSVCVGLEDSWQRILPLESSNSLCWCEMKTQCWEESICSALPCAWEIVFNAMANFQTNEITGTT